MAAAIIDVVSVTESSRFESFSSARLSSSVRLRVAASTSARTCRARAREAKLPETTEKDVMTHTAMPNQRRLELGRRCEKRIGFVLRGRALLRSSDW